MVEQVQAVERTRASRQNASSYWKLMTNVETLKVQRDHDRYGTVGEDRKAGRAIKCKSEAKYGGFGLDPTSWHKVQC